MIKRLPYQEFIKIYSRVPRLCTEVLIKTSQGILLTKRAIPPAKGFWHLPGKTMLKGCDIEENVRQVAQNELGVDVKIVKFVKVIDWFGSKNATGQSVSLVYLVKIKNGQKIKLNNEASEFGFFKSPPQKTIKEHQELFLIPT